MYYIILSLTSILWTIINIITNKQTG